jgi:peptidoglycan biosynthesis protein MviN/MurJ (putative lipid II flippase)
MVLVWLIFTLMLFIVEPFVLRRQINNTEEHDAGKIFARMRRMHWILLSLSLVAVAGAVAGSHGWMIRGG